MSGPEGGDMAHVEEKYVSTCCQWWYSRCSDNKVYAPGQDTRDRNEMDMGPSVAGQEVAIPERD